MKTVNIHIRYMNNVVRRTLPVLTCSYAHPHEILHALYEHLEQNDCLNTQAGHFVLESDLSIVIHEDNILEHICGDSIHLLFLGIVPVHNAQEYDRFNGIVIFFHTSEQCHLYSPHIHAQYGEDTIKISLTDFHIIGKFRNSKKQKEALQYTKNNRESLLQEWNTIIGKITAK